MKKITAFAGVLLLSSSLLAACSPTATPNRPGGNQAGVQNIGGVRDLNNRYNTMGTRDTANRAGLRTDPNLEARVEAIPGIRNATVLVAGNTAYVGINQGTATPNAARTPGANAGPGVTSYGGAAGNVGLHNNFGRDIGYNTNRAGNYGTLRPGTAGMGTYNLTGLPGVVAPGTYGPGTTYGGTVGGTTRGAGIGTYGGTTGTGNVSGIGGATTRGNTIVGTGPYGTAGQAGVTGRGTVAGTGLGAGTGVGMGAGARAGAGTAGAGAGAGAGIAGAGQAMRGAGNNLAAGITQDRSVAGDIKAKVANTIRQANPSIRNVYVTANPGIIGRMDAFVRDTAAGHPVRGTNDLLDTLRRMFPAGR